MSVDQETLSVIYSAIAVAAIIVVYLIGNALIKRITPQVIEIEKMTRGARMVQEAFDEYKSLTANIMKVLCTPEARGSEKSPSPILRFDTHLSDTNEIYLQVQKVGNNHFILMYIERAYFRNDGTPIIPIYDHLVNRDELVDLEIAYAKSGLVEPSCIINALKSYL